LLNFYNNLKANERQSFALVEGKANGS